MIPIAARNPFHLLRGPAPFRAAALALWLSLSAGCQQMAILGYHLTGGETIEARYKFVDKRVALLLDDPQGLVLIPAVFRAVHEGVEQEFTANGVKAQLIAFEQIEKLRRQDPDFDSLSVREIGEKVGADEVLYLKVTDFRLQAEPGAPLFQGRIAVRASVLTTERRRDVRLWPQQAGGEEVVAETPPESSEGETSAGDVARALSARLAGKVARLFYDHKEKG